MANLLNTIPLIIINVFKTSTLKQAVQKAVAAGITSVDALTDIAFFVRHPDRNGKNLAGHETALIKEWKAIRKEIERLFASIPAAPIGPAPTGTDCPWMVYAKREMKRWATMEETSVTTDQEYFRATPYWGSRAGADGRIPTLNRNWCAAFVNWCLHRSGFSHTGSAWQGSFKKGNRKFSKWKFNALKKPRVGCVVLIGKESSPSHIGFLNRVSRYLPTGTISKPAVIKSGVHLHLLGGNQTDSDNGDRVCVKDYGNGRGYKIFPHQGQDGVKSPYFWPLRGGTGCKILSVPTDHDHFCGENPVS